MPPLLVPANTVLRRKPDEPLGYQLYDTFEDYFSPEIQERLRKLNQSFPIQGLSAAIVSNEITKGQWLLYTHVCFVGQIVNGGVEQFFDNCPGLILDADKLLTDFGSSDLKEAYSLAAKRFLEVIDHHAGKNPEATGEELSLFYADLDAAWCDDDEDRFRVIESACYARDRDSDASNWFTQLEKRVLDWVLKHPAEFTSAN